MYEPKARTTSIKATSRASVKVRDNFYTVEFSEERIIPDLPDIDMEQEKSYLWDAVNNQCDSQIEEIVKSFK